MQSLTPVLPGTLAPGATRTSEGVRALPGVRTDAPAAARAPVVATPASVLRGGLRDWNPQLNQHVAGAQRTIGYLDEVSGQLRQLRHDVSARLAGREPQAGAAAETLQQFARTWRERPAATAGRLSPRLAYGEGEAPQRFTVRGLTLQALRTGEKETLAFALGGAARSQPTVLVEPGLDDEALVQRFDQALAASRIRVRRDDSGSLVFSTPESAWPQVRDTLAVRGGGIRFPTGQFNRVRVDAEPDALQPQHWRLDDPAAMRDTLAQVVQALDAVRQARSDVEHALDAAGAALEAAQPGETADAAAAFVRRFEALARERGYASHQSVAASLLGVHRERVQALLTLRD